MKTEIGEIPDSFIAKVTAIGNTKYIHIPIKVCEVGDYDVGDTIRVWIKKVAQRGNMALIKARHIYTDKIVYFDWFVSIKQAKYFNRYFTDWEYI